MKRHPYLILLTRVVWLSALLLAGCSPTPSQPEAAGPVNFPKIDRHPPASQFRPKPLKEMPKYEPKPGEIWQVDLRTQNLSEFDLTGSLDSLLLADFDTLTTWPPEDKMPAGFDSEQILELSKNPGLGLRRLHEQGITGKGVGIGIIDQPLLGVFVISSSLGATHGLHFQGLGRPPLADPDQFTSFEPGSWWAEQFPEQMDPSETLLVPMDSRTTAAPDGPQAYVFYRGGGWSWAIPYIAGMYALANQVAPGITPEQFWQAALDSGQQVDIQGHLLQTVLDPAALIQALR